MIIGWDREFYKRGYEGFESQENFPTAEALADYRRLLQRKTEAQVTFLARHLGDSPLRVVEFGSGNGRLLIALAQRGMLKFGLGIEIAESRVRFAQQWTSDAGLDSLIRVIAADALAFEDFESSAFDLVVCITGAFGYFRPIDESAPVVLLKKMRGALSPDGHLVLELYQLPENRRQMLLLNEGKLRTWQPLPPEDRFAYYLDDFEYWDDRQVMRHEKIFIGRNGVIDAGRVEVLAYYTKAELTDLLRQNGFEVAQVYAGFDDASYHEGQSAALVVLARKS